jgi:hypothetical protein
LAEEYSWRETGAMTRIHIFCEGQTEETLIREVLQDHFQRIDTFVNPIIVRTSKTGKGGVSTYGKIKSQINRKCLEDPTAWVTTMLDYYGLPSDFPGKQSAAAVSSLNFAEHLEKSFQQDIGRQNFIANLVVHEFEGLLYSNPSAFEGWFNAEARSKLAAERALFESPEHINDNPDTTPSRRIKKHCHKYDKITHGTLICLDIGLDVIRHECHHFDNWLKKLEEL